MRLIKLVLKTTLYFDVNDTLSVKSSVADNHCLSESCSRITGTQFSSLSVNGSDFLSVCLNTWKGCFPAPSPEAGKL